jgi:hypothetical protein
MEQISLRNTNRSEKAAQKGKNSAYLKLLIENDIIPSIAFSSSLEGSIIITYFSFPN